MMNLIVNSAFQSLIGAQSGPFAPCVACTVNESTHVVGGATLVCDPCLDHGDRRRLWNLEPRYRL